MCMDIVASGFRVVRSACLIEGPSHFIYMIIGFWKPRAYFSSMT
jgi:hypothetical protein